MTFANSIEHEEMYFSSWMLFANSIEHDEMYKYNSAIKFLLKCFIAKHRYPFSDSIFEAIQCNL